ncbi:MAG: hypothetical protein WBG63_18450 [Phormidesmis sp.]
MPFNPWNTRRSLLLTYALSAIAGLISTSCASPSVSQSVSQNISQSAGQSANQSAVISTALTSASAKAEVLTPESSSEDEIDSSDAYAQDDHRVDAYGNLLPDIIDGLAVGMPYAEARELIVGAIWQPKTYPPASLGSTTVENLYNIGYEEVRDCAGTGLGLCRMEFIEREGLIFVVIVTTSEAVPTVWSWDIE